MSSPLTLAEMKRRLVSYADCPVRLDPAEQGEVWALETVLWLAERARLATLDCSSCYESCPPYTCDVGIKETRDWLEEVPDERGRDD
jgi:hypothetical protein